MSMQGHSNRQGWGGGESTGEWGFSRQGGGRCVLQELHLSDNLFSHEGAVRLVQAVRQSSAYPYPTRDYSGTIFFF